MSRRTDRAKRRSSLREQVFERDGGRCIWPGCGEWATELAHFSSIGMGGRVSADSPENAGAMCYDHARISDGEYGTGGRAEYLEAHRRLLGQDFVEMPQHRVAWERGEALRRLVS